MAGLVLFWPGIVSTSVVRMMNAAALDDHAEPGRESRSATPAVVAAAPRLCKSDPPRRPFPDIRAARETPARRGRRSSAFQHAFQRSGSRVMTKRAGLSRHSVSCRLLATAAIGLRFAIVNSYNVQAVRLKPVFDFLT